MNKGNKNIFAETVDTLINDGKILTKKYHDFLNGGRTREAIDTLRLLKDTLSLIKEYDWHLEYSEYETDGHNEVAVWEQNHSGEIRNKRKWFVKEAEENFWYKTFSYYIKNSQSYLVEKGFSQMMRGSGKSTALAKLCHEYRGIVVYNMGSGFRAVQYRSEELGYINSSNQFVKYEDYINNIEEYKNEIVFLDECHGLDCEEIERIKENNLVIGFEA